MAKQSKQTEGVVKGDVGAYTVTFNPHLGSGTFGVVYEAIDNRTNTMVAMKQLKIAEHGKINKYFDQMAAKELEIIQKLSQHPHIIKLYEHIYMNNPEKGTENCYLVMELCQSDLQTFLSQNEDLEMVRKFEFMNQAASAVAFMHRQDPSIIHRDLKLQNILIKQKEGKYMIKIVDFGLSKIYDGIKASFSHAYKTTYMATACGSNMYQAPEFFEESENGLQYDASVDTFALGLIFAVLLAPCWTYNGLLPLSGNLVRYFTLFLVRFLHKVIRTW